VKHSRPTSVLNWVVRTHNHSYVWWYLVVNLLQHVSSSSTLYYDAAEEAKQKWQDERTACAKAAITKQYFPTVRDRLKVKVNLTPNLVAMLTGQGRTRAYLFRFKLRDDATCICGQDDQTTDHLLNHCTMLHAQREMLKHYILKGGNWPTRKQELIINYRNSFIAFIESIDFEQLYRAFHNVLHDYKHF
jgi:hypothetical protein